MDDGLELELSGPLRRHVEERTGAEGLYGSTSEYLRDLIRRDYEREQEHRWAFLRQEISEATNVPSDRLAVFDPDAIIAEAKGRKALKQDG